MPRPTLRDQIEELVRESQNRAIADSYDEMTDEEQRGIALLSETIRVLESLEHLLNLRPDYVLSVADLRARLEEGYRDG